MSEEKEYIAQEQVDRKFACLSPLTDGEVNKRLHEDFGKCWHRWEFESVCPEEYQCRKCGIKVMATFPPLVFPRPRYCTDPLLVLREMRRREDFCRWVSVINSLSFDEDGYLLDNVISIGLILDNPGKLARLALEWVERRGK